MTRFYFSETLGVRLLGILRVAEALKAYVPQKTKKVYIKNWHSERWLPFVPNVWIYSCIPFFLGGGLLRREREPNIFV